jgi:hypothetical protein
MISINPQVDYFINEKEKNIVLFVKNSNDIFTLNNSAYLIFNELSKKHPKDLKECQQIANELSLTNHIFFSTIEHFIKLKFVLADVKKSDYVNFIEQSNDQIIDTTIKKLDLQEMFYEPNLIARALADGDGGGGDNGIAVPPFHFGDGY